MVNWIEVQKQFLSKVAMNAGLRQHSTEVDGSGTVMNFWLPKYKVPPPMSDTNPTPIQSYKSRIGSTTMRGKPSVVLVHGFAGDGIITWGFQVGALAKQYDVYVPDLLFFGGSTSPLADRSTAFQAECIVTALQKFGVKQCTLVGFSYGGFLAFRMAGTHPKLVRSVVISGSAITLTQTMKDAMLMRLGAKTLVEMLLPDSVEGLKSLFVAAIYRKIWLPDRLLQDFLKAFFTNRKERTELLENLVLTCRNQDVGVPDFHQNLLLLWGEQDRLFTVDHARRLKELLGRKATLQIISKAGHLVHLERPCVYNRYIKEFLAQVNAS